MTEGHLKEGSKEPSLLLDSRLISPTILSKYDIKIVDCGDYTQVYYYQNPRTKKVQKEDLDLKLKKAKIDKFFEKQSKENKEDKSLKLKEILPKNIIRSKLECQRIAKANADKWETFITLTIANNIQDIKEANKIFRYFIDKVRRVKKEFSYIAIPEFQKRGAVHYHLLCNVNINDKTLIFDQESNPKFKHIKFWNQGFTSVEVMKGDIKKIVGYISKYMTKDIDNRLFGQHRYLYSHNLNMPKENYINTDNELEKNFYKKKIQDKELIYQNEYINPFDNNKVVFLEFVKK